MYKISASLLLLILAQSAPTLAAPLSFDCDVPPDHFSSVSEDLTALPAISGTVKLVQMRSGNNLPVAGVRFVGADEKNSVGFQLVATSLRAKQFDIILNLKRDGNLQRNSVGQIDADVAIPFNFSVSDAGTVTLLIGTKSFSAEFMPLRAGKVMAFCSTAQFKFTKLKFATQ